jgi:glucosylceramidase
MARHSGALALASLLVCFASAQTVEVWQTNSDLSSQLARQPSGAFVAGGPKSRVVFAIDDSTAYQEIDGFGASLTDSSSWLIYTRLPASQRAQLMRQLFDRNSGIGLSFIRQPMGASDFAREHYTYSNAPGEFSIAHDEAYILPLLQQARAINPSLKIMASPWSAPAWMKTTGSLIGGSLRADAAPALAEYFVRFIRAYEAAGIPIYAVTPNNEPLFEPADYPGMEMTAEQQRQFIRDQLGPAFARAGIKTKILTYDHNWDRPDYPRAVLSDPDAAAYISGTAWHCYGGDVSAQTVIRKEFPEKDAWETECSGGTWQTGAPLAESAHLVIRSTRNWAHSVVFWNMALDQDNGPYKGGCHTCRGVVTIDHSKTPAHIGLNGEYFALGHASKFVSPGARRIESGPSDAAGVEQVAFKNPDHSLVLIALNNGNAAAPFNVTWAGKSFTYTISNGALVTLRWRPQETSAAAALDVWPVDSLLKVFPEDAPGTNRAPRASSLVARNGHTSIQIAVRSAAVIPALTGSVNLAGGLRTEVRRVGFVPVHHNVPDTPASELARAAPGLFPDPLFEDNPFPVEANQTTSVWITVYAPPLTAPGVYRGTLTLTSDDRRLGSIPLEVTVASATVPAMRILKVSNWFYFNQDLLAPYFDVNDQPEKLWDLLANSSRVLADHGQNVFLTPVLALTAAEVNGAALAYDFSRLDRFIDIVTKTGAMEIIEGSHVLERDGGYDGPLKVPGFLVEHGQARRYRFDIDEARAEAQLKSFLTALYGHLAAKGWLSRYTQHVLDEPHGTEPAAYLRYSKIIRASMPGVAIIDAFDQHAKGWLGDATDIEVLQLGKFDNSMDIIREHARRGGKAWYYTCLFPRGAYPNRFIDFPLLKTRLLQWLNYRFDLTGYLHWGANSWGPNPYEITELGLEVGAPTTGALPAGDAFITYPSRKANSILSSIRLEAMREGIEDYELLKALAAHNPRLAAELARRMMPSLTDYVRDVSSFRTIQAELLNAGQ